MKLEGNITFESNDLFVQLDISEQRSLILTSVVSGAIDYHYNRMMKERLPFIAATSIYKQIIEFCCNVNEVVFAITKCNKMINEIDIKMNNYFNTGNQN